MRGGEVTIFSNRSAAHASRRDLYSYKFEVSELVS